MYCLGVTTVLAQLPDPALDFVFPAGGQVGTMVTVQIGGRDLDDAQSLVFSHPGLQGQIDTRPPGEFETGPQPIANQFRIDIPANLVPGAYDLHVVGRFGVSTPRTFVVGRETELTDTADNHQPTTATPVSLGSVVNGRADSGAVDYYKVTAKAGQPLAIACSTQRIDSQLLPVVTVWTAEGKQIGRTTQTVDPVLPLVVPADGDYTIGIHDRIFGGGGTHAYRLRIVSGPYVVAVEPNAALPGQRATLTMHGLHLPGATNESPWKIGSTPLQQSTIQLFMPDHGDRLSVDTAQAEGEGFVYQGVGDLATLEIPIALAEQPVVSEAEPNQSPEAAQSISIPVEISGRFYPRRDQDWYVFPAKAGQRFQVRVLSHRHGVPTDAELFVQKVVKDANGQVQVTQVSTDDDFPANDQRYRQALRRGLDLSHRDPSVSFVADQDADYRVGLRDLGGSSLDDPRLIYRLVIEPQKPNFRLLAWVQRQAVDDDKKIEPAGWSIRPGGNLPVLVELTRLGGLDGAVQVTAENLPPGVTARPCVIAPGQTEATLMLSAAKEVAAWTGPIRIVGTAFVSGVSADGSATGESTIQRFARSATLMSPTANVEAARPAARAMRDLVLSVAAQDPAIAKIDLGNPDDARAVWRTSLGGKLSIPVSYTKTGTVKGELVLVPIGIPAEVKAGNVTLAADAAAGQLDLTLDSNKPVPGTYTIWLRGKVPATYARNPQAIERLVAQRQSMDVIFKQLAEETAQADTMLAEAQKVLADKAEQSTQLQNAQQSLQKSLEAVTQQLTEAQQHLASVQTLASSQGGDALVALAKQVEATTKAVHEQLEATRAPIDSLGEKIAELQSSLEASRQAVAKAEEQKKALTDKKARADEFVKGLDQRVAEAQANWGPKDLTIYLDSTPCTLEIAPTPLSASLSQSSLKLAAGQESSLDVQLERLFGFADKVTLEWEVPQGVDLKGDPVVMAADQSRGAMKIVAGAQVAKGRHSLQLRLSLQFNGVDLQQRIPVVIDIE